MVRSQNSTNCDIGIYFATHVWHGMPHIPVCMCVLPGEWGWGGGVAIAVVCHLETWEREYQAIYTGWHLTSPWQEPPQNYFK